MWPISPAPWSLDPVAHHTDYVVRDAAGAVAAYVPKRGGKPETMRLADARVIRSAPGLLAAAELAADLIDDLRYALPAANAVLDQARTVLRAEIDVAYGVGEPGA